MKKIRFFILLFVSIVFVQSLDAQSKYPYIYIEVDNQTHEVYEISGHITDGTNTVFYSFTALPGQVTIHTLVVNSTNWVREDFRAWHTTYTPPAANLIGNAPGPEAVFSGIFTGYFNYVRQDPMYTSGLNKFYLYNIKHN